MFPLTPDQHHWLEVATEDEGYDDTVERSTDNLPVEEKRKDIIKQKYSIISVCKLFLQSVKI